MGQTSPLEHYRNSLRMRRADEARLRATDRRLGTARLVTVGVTVFLLWLVLSPGLISAWWVALPAVAFAGLMRRHDRVIRAHETAVRAVTWYEWGIARLENRWMDFGEPGDRFLDEDHPYARDLDIFGHGSVFQLLNTAQTTGGEETLADWLRAPAEPSVVRSRQQAVDDMSGRTSLREALYTLGVEARRSVDSADLVRWATAPDAFRWRGLRVGARTLTGILVASVAAWLAGQIPGAVPLTVALLNASASVAFGAMSSRVLHGGSEPARELVILAAVLDRLRHEAYVADRLRQLHATLLTEHHATEPVLAVRRLERYFQMHDWQHNMFFAPFAAVLLWGLQCAASVEAWRALHGPSVDRWLQSAGELEALAAFGTYRFEHPDDPFPEVLEPVIPPVYDASGLAHPLLPATQAVSNDIRLGQAPQLIIVSGSNMSGKTTLLRTVGVNGVLALAGAPVRARSLRLSPVTIGGTLRVEDSLLAGRSRFYAEILRVKQIVEIARGPHSLLFLMDELFNGTNSHDRVEGAHGVLRFLVELHAIGMITTHDLALADIGERLGTRAVNVHFADQLVDGSLSFDYRLQDGRATHGNALALMQAVGLHVTDPITESRG